MTLTNKSLPRRTVLRGIGATLALPFLDAMAPAVSSVRAAAKPAQRFQAFYTPNGMAMPYWTPEKEGTDFALSPILEPLAPFKDQVIVLSGLNASWNHIHAGASGSFLTGMTRGGRNETEILGEVSMDQLLARHFARDTQVASLAVAMDPAEQCRRLHREPELRLHAHDLVAQPDPAAADGVESRARSSRPCSATAAAPSGRRARRGCGSTRACSTR